MCYLMNLIKIALIGLYKSVTKIIVPIPLIAVAGSDVWASSTAGLKETPVTIARIKALIKSVISLTTTPDETASVTNQIRSEKRGYRYL